MKKLTYLILVFLMIGCQEGGKQNEDVNWETVEPKDSISVNPEKELNEYVLYESFDLIRFKNDIDSFLVTFTGVQAEYDLTIDTITTNLHSNVLLDSTLLKYLVANSTRFIHYAFDDQKTRENLDFKLIEIQLKDSIQRKSVFNTLDAYANTRAKIDSFQYVPCLTYQNDRLLVGQEKMFWLNNNCRFSYNTHKDYVTMLRSSLKDFAPLDSILCECGDVVSRK